MLGKGSLKAEPNYFSSLALNIFAQYWHLSFFFSLYYHEINFNSKVNFYTLLFLVSLFHNKRWDFQQNCSITSERVMSTCVFVVTYIYIYRPIHYV